MAAAVTIKAATLFSGIGAPEAAMPGWRWLWHAETEPFPAAVLAARHPRSANLGDVTAHDFAHRALAAGRPDVLVFGSPCQSFSVAGKRLGLDDPRGNLALVALAVVRRVRPRWLVFENVPGLLSSGGGDDFAAFLAAVQECGYLGCWRVLDARHWGLAQRRQRVFFVGCVGEWRGPAEVLSLAEGLRGYPETGGEAGQGIARPLAAGSPRGSGYRNDADIADNLIAFQSNFSNQGVQGDIPTLTANAHTAVAYGGNDTRGPIEVATALNAHGGPHGRLDFESETFVAQVPRQSHPAVFLHANKGRPAGRKSAHEPMVSVKTVVPTLATDGHAQSAVATAAAIRRLTPTECERLMGFPDGHTAIPYRGKPAADGPRYRALGNSMAVPVVGWLLARIGAQLAATEENAA